MKRTFQIASILLFLSSCSESKLSSDLNSPDQRIQLSKELNEISGIDFLSDSIICSVQDEKALIYYLNTSSGQIIEKFDFGKNGDYEGITHYKDDVYVLRSDGHIFSVNKTTGTKEFKFKRNKRFDFEGLCLDKSNMRLLLACKEHGDKDKRNHFFIYSFSLETKEFQKKPVFKIKRNKGLKNFKPSGIAIHPDGNIYILSSFSKTLLILSPEGFILETFLLNSHTFHQPEGIAFNSRGELFISNEKHNLTPTILKFKKLSHEKD